VVSSGATPPTARPTSFASSSTGDTHSTEPIPPSPPPPPPPHGERHDWATRPAVDLGTSVHLGSHPVSRTGHHRAIVGSGDVENVGQSGAWTDVVGYVQDFGAALREALAEFDPRTLALNYSVDNFMADGLTHGMYLRLEDILGDTPHWDRVVWRAGLGAGTLAQIREDIAGFAAGPPARSGPNRAWLRPDLTDWRSRP